MTIVATIQLKKYITNAGVFCIIIGKLNHWKKLCLILLFKVDKDLKVNFYNIVLLLNLIVYLKQFFYLLICMKV